MKVYQDEFEMSTSKRIQVIDITDKVNKVVDKSGLNNGIVQILVPHATAGIILEEVESGLIKDIENKVENMFPKGEGYEHDRIDDNANSHLASGFIGQSRILPIKDGRIVRGTWQRPMLLEFDGPRSHRRVFITVIGE